MSKTPLDEHFNESSPVEEMLLDELAMRRAIMEQQSKCLRGTHESGGRLYISVNNVRMTIAQCCKHCRCVFVPLEEWLRWETQGEPQ